MISGIQQFGIGVADLDEAWAWYREHFGLDVPIFKDAAPAPFMTRYTGDAVHERSAVLAVNLMGGSGFEVWQYTSRTPDAPAKEVELGDFGVFSVKVRCPDIDEAFAYFAEQGITISEAVHRSPYGLKHFFVKDPYGNVFDIEQSEGWFSKIRAITGGPSGCTIGVSNIERSLKLYQNVLGYDEVVYDKEGVFDDLKALHGGSGSFRRVLITHRNPRLGHFSRILGASTIELIESKNRECRKIFGDRFWGDLGFIHICFDIRGMELLEAKCAKEGFPFTVNSKDSFDMGEASGHFSYLEDPDGTLIEFVETHRMPIVKKLGLYLDLRKRDAFKPLPDWMLKALKFTRVRRQPQ